MIHWIKKFRGMIYGRKRTSYQVELYLHRDISFSKLMEHFLRMMEVLQNEETKENIRSYEYNLSSNMRREESDCSLYLDSCQAPASEKVSVSAKATGHLTSFSIMDHPTCDVDDVVGDIDYVSSKNEIKF